MAIDIDDIVSEFGDYYQAGSANVNNLHAQITAPSDTDRLFIPVPTEDTIIKNAYVEVDDVLQGFQDEFTRKGNTIFYPEQLILDQLKIDVEENPSKLESKWLGFLAGIKEADRSKWPFVRWWIEVLLIPKAIENWEMKAVFGGVKGAVTPGTPWAVEDAVDGIKQQINIHINNGKCDPYVLGAVPTDPQDFVVYMEAFAAYIPKYLKPKLQDIAMSDTLLQRFKTGMRRTYNMNYDQADITKIMDTNLTCVGLLSHEGSDKIWTTVKGNAICAQKRSSDASVFRIEYQKRMVSAYTDWYKKCGFSIPQFILSNDVELDVA